VTLDDAVGLHAPELRVDDALEREFARRVQESGTLAFRVAFGVLRRAEDAEEVAQEALLKAQRRFGSLRDRERFRGWVVRLTFRMALDRSQGNEWPSPRSREYTPHYRPVLPNPPAPREEAGSSATVRNSTRSTLAITICAIRIPRVTRKLSVPRFTRMTFSSPR
jgi:DNA-directed RNA polymerase specialized sigma24 family protein